jgi:hypothetical protein
VSSPAAALARIDTWTANVRQEWLLDAMKMVGGACMLCLRTEKEHKLSSFRRTLGGRPLLPDYFQELEFDLVCCRTCSEKGRETS